MKKSLLWIFVVSAAFWAASCDYYSYDGKYSDGSSSGVDGNGDSIPNAEAGLVTAGEWNDLDHWDFWCNLLTSQEDSSGYDQYPVYWRYNTQHRIALTLMTSGQPLADASLVLKNGENVVWQAKSDNLGRAELWVALTEADEDALSIDNYQLYVNNQLCATSLKWNQPDTIEVTANPSSFNTVQLAFVVDATGSMSDEMDFLKEDLQDVIKKVKDQNASLTVYTAALFYRDEGDDYVTKNSDFTTDLNSTINYIGKQKANGGEDYPEAVHTAMKAALNNLQWADEARTRIAFMLLDAPPHYDAQIVDDIHQSVRKYAAKGIKLIPVAASGIDKETEFLLRYFAIATNGTYVFITNDSGIGYDHLTPSVGEYQVEYLNDLLFRLIKKYSD